MALFIHNFKFLFTFQDESTLIWYSGRKEKQLKLSNVSKIIPGQRTVSSCNHYLVIFLFVLIAYKCNFHPYHVLIYGGIIGLLKH